MCCPELNWSRNHPKHRRPAYIFQIGREDSEVVGRVNVQDEPLQRGNGAAHGILDLWRSVVDHLTHLDFFLAPHVVRRHKAMLKTLEDTQAVANHCARRSVIRLCLPEVWLIKSHFTLIYIVKLHLQIGEGYDKTLILHWRSHVFNMQANLLYAGLVAFCWVCVLLCVPSIVTKNGRTGTQVSEFQNTGSAPLCTRP